MDCLLRRAVVVSAAAHVVAVAALPPAQREAPSLPMLDARLLVPPQRPVAPLPPAALGERQLATPTPVPRSQLRRPVPVLAIPGPASHAAPAAPAAPAGTLQDAVPAGAVTAMPVTAVTPARYDAAYLANPPPPYPTSARRRGSEGTVAVDARVGVEGEAKEVRLAASAGDDALDGAALEAVRHWRFIPARRGEQSIEAWVRVPLVFRLN